MAIPRNLLKSTLLVTDVFCQDVGDWAVQAVRIRKVARRMCSEFGTPQISRIESAKRYAKIVIAGERSLKEMSASKVK